MEEFNPDEVGSIFWQTQDGRNWITDDHTAVAGDAIETVHVSDYNTLLDMYNELVKGAG